MNKKIVTKILFHLSNLYLAVCSHVALANHLGNHVFSMPQSLTEEHFRHLTASLTQTLHINQHHTAILSSLIFLLGIFIGRWIIPARNAKTDWGSSVMFQKRR